MATTRTYLMILWVIVGVVIGTALGWVKEGLCELKNWKN
jgi:hypothetical protein